VQACRSLRPLPGSHRSLRFLRLQTHCRGSVRSNGTFSPFKTATVVGRHREPQAIVSAAWALPAHARRQVRGSKGGGCAMKGCNGCSGRRLPFASAFVLGYDAVSRPRCPPVAIASVNKTTALPWYEECAPCMTRCELPDGAAEGTPGGAFEGTPCRIHRRCSGDMQMCALHKRFTALGGWNTDFRPLVAYWSWLRDPCCGVYASTSTSAAVLHLLAPVLACWRLPPQSNP